MFHPPITDQNIFDIKRLCSQGLHITEVARRLGLSEMTVRRYRSGGVKKSAAPQMQSKIVELNHEVESLRAANEELEKMEACYSGAMKKAMSLALPSWLSRPKIDKKFRHGTPTLLISDVHWGEIVYPEQINYVNQYNLAIARKRLEVLFQTTLEFLRDVFTPSDYSGIVVLLGGDIVSGYIHEELRQAADLSLIEQALDAAKYLTAGLKMLADNLGKVQVIGVVGNHGRLDQKPRAKFGVVDNMDWLVYTLIAGKLEDDNRFTFMFPRSMDAHFQVFNHRYLLTHGNSFKGGSGISGPLTPWALGDFRRRIRQDAVGQGYDTLVFGHFHTQDWGLNDRWIAGGTTKGYDEYSFNKSFPFSRPQHPLWLTHPAHKITIRVGILVDRYERDGSGVLEIKPTEVK